MTKEKILRLLKHVHYGTVDYCNDFCKKELKDRYNVTVVSKNIKLDDIKKETQK